ncbi:hypothetical protein Tco_0466625, partial [Tanacetum coccineum]
AGANLDKKSKTGGCQFLGRRLISWQCKKQTIVATSTTKAEYVAAANCYGQVLWIQNQMLDYEFNFMNTKNYIDNESTICIIKNLVYHSKTKHIAIRHHFIRDAYEKKLIQVSVLGCYNWDDQSISCIKSLGRALDGTEALLLPKLFILWLVKVSTDNANLVPLGKVVLELCPKHNMVAYLEKTVGNAKFHEVIDFLARSSIHNALTVSPVVSITFVEQFWMSAKSKISNNVRYITAKVASKPVSISEASIRSDLLFDDADGIDSLPNQAIFDAIKFSGPFTLLLHIPDSISAGFLVGIKEVTDQAKEIKHLKAQIKKLKKKAKPVITHHRAWMKFGRKSAKAEPSVHIDPVFDELADDTLDYMETEDTQDVGRTRKEKVSTDRSRVSTDKEEVSIDRPDEGTDDQTEGKSDTPTTQTPTPTTFGDDETITQDERWLERFKKIGKQREVKKLAEEEAIKATLSNEYDLYPSKNELIDLALRLKDEEMRSSLLQKNSKDTAKVDVTEQGTKKRKGGHMKMLARKRKRPQSDVDSDDEHRKCLKIVTFEGTIDSEIMERKSVIARLNKVSSPDGDYLVIYRANGNFRAFNCLLEVLHIFDRQDLFHLYDLVMEQYSEITLEGIELILWGDLKIMMESSQEENDQSDLWDDQQDWEIVTWRLYEACGVYILELKDGTVIHMLVERRYPLSKDLLQRMLDLGLEVERESTAALDLIRFIKQQIDEN